MRRARAGRGRPGDDTSPWRRFTKALNGVLLLVRDRGTRPGRWPEAREGSPPAGRPRGAGSGREIGENSRTAQPGAAWESGSGVGTVQIGWPSSSSGWGPESSGSSEPGRDTTSKISSTPVTNSRCAASRPVRRSIDADAALQLVAPLGDRHAAEGRRLADLRQADERVRAEQRQPAGEAGQLGHVSHRPVAGSTTTSRPAPESSTQSRPPWTRGECGMAKPRATVSPLGTSIRQPPVALFRPPALRRVGLAQRGDVLRLARRPSPGR